MERTQRLDIFIQNKAEKPTESVFCFPISLIMNY